MSIERKARAINPAVDLRIERFNSAITRVRSLMEMPGNSSWPENLRPDGHNFQGQTKLDKITVNLHTRTLPFLKKAREEFAREKRRPTLFQEENYSFSDLRMMSGLPKTPAATEMIKAIINQDASAADKIAVDSGSESFTEEEVGRLIPNILNAKGKIHKKEEVAIALPDGQVIMKLKGTLLHQYLELFIKAFPKEEPIPIQNFANIHDSSLTKQKMSEAIGSTIYRLRQTLRNNSKWDIERSKSPEGEISYRLAPKKDSDRKKPKEAEITPVETTQDGVKGIDTTDEVNSHESKQHKKERSVKEQRAIDEARKAIKIRFSIVVVTNIVNKSHLFDKDLAMLLRNQNRNEQLTIGEIVGDNSLETLQKFFIEGLTETLRRWLDTKDINSIPVREQDAAQTCRGLKSRGVTVERIVQFAAKHYSIPPTSSPEQKSPTI